MGWRWGGVLLAVLVVLALVGIGVGAFHAGEVHALAQHGRVIVGPYRYGPPFGFVGFLFPLLFIVLLVALFSSRRRAWWGYGHHWHDHPHGPWGGPGTGGPGQRFDEWHRRAHGEDAPTSTTPPRPEEGSGAA